MEGLQERGTQFTQLMYDMATSSSLTLPQAVEQLRRDAHIRTLGETLEKYAQQYGWTLIDDSNRKDMFMDMIRQMDMSYSYKPVLIKAVLLYADERGRVKLEDIVSYFKSCYEGRRSVGLTVEKKNSIF